VAAQTISSGRRNEGPSARRVGRGEGDEAVDVIAERIDEVLERLGKLEAALDALVRQRTVKDWYGTDEFAQLVHKAEFTVREWCRNGRVRAEKRLSGRGAFPAWVISHQELLRYQREGLLPLRAQGMA
jgi:C4-dicarboxylate-specific signal transduction histidine kinase